MKTRSILSMLLVASLLAARHAAAMAPHTQPIRTIAQASTSSDRASGMLLNQLPPMAPGVVLVALEEGTTVSHDPLGVRSSEPSLSRLLAETGVERAEPVFPDAAPSKAPAVGDDAVDLSSILRLLLPQSADVPGAVEALSQHPAVVYAEPDYVAHVVATPNDPRYSEQWGLAQVDAPTAWDVVTGTSEVVIAVIDAGLQVGHPDLASQLWTNPGEIPSNGVDDDNNGYIDDVHGWNLVDASADLTDNTGHGTQVAGVIAAATNNGLGVAGVCWGCRLMIVKVVQPGGFANYSDIAAGVVYAAQKGAEVINLSLGGYSDSATLRAAVAEAAQTAVVVGGAGNHNTQDPFYPAAYDASVLAVAGTTASDTKLGTSNYGAWVDVSAPAEAILTTFDGSGYGSASGTSMAAPFASGLAGLLRSLHPTWSPNHVRAQIVQTTDDIDGLNPGHEGLLGTGRIDAGQAVSSVVPPLLTYEGYAVDGEPSGRVEPGDTVDVVVTLYNAGTRAANVQATLSTTDTHVTIESETSSFGTMDAYERRSNGTPFRFTVSSSTPYAYDIPFTLSLTADGGYQRTLSFAVATVSGQLEVYGPISANTTWTADKEYVVTSSILIPGGITLTIEPGTKVSVYGQEYFRVEGELVAKGSVDALIHFSNAVENPASEEDYWSGIRFVNGGQGELSYCWIEDTHMTGLRAEQSSVQIDHLLFSNNWAGLTIDGGGPSAVRDSRFWDNGTGGADFPLYFNGSVEFTNNLVYDNYSWEDGTITAAVLGLSRGTVMSNTIINNEATGLLLASEHGFHHNNLLANTPYDVRAGHWPAVVTATAVYWGEETTAEMQAEGPNSDIEAIDDFHDDLSLSLVDYSGWRTTPEPAAPGFVWRLSIAPDTVIGIQQATFDLSFSRPMDQSIDPSVSFGATEPYSSYQIVDNAQWVDASHWRATYEVTSLVPRGAYTLTVSRARGDDGMEIPPDTRFGFAVDYAGEISDVTPPPPPTVMASGIDGDASKVEASWSASDPESAITGYRYAIGSAAGASDIVSWTPTSGTTMSRTGLGLSEGQQYWLGVQARNVGGLWSAIGHSSFVAGQGPKRVFLPLVLK